MNSAWETIATARRYGYDVECTYPGGSTARFTLGVTERFPPEYGHCGFNWIRLSHPDGPVTAHTVANAIRLCDPDVRLLSREDPHTSDMEVRA